MPPSIPSALILLCALLAGCATTSPPTRQAPALPENWQQPVEAGAALSTRFQAVLRSESLNQLIDQVLQHNLELQQNTLLVAEQQLRLAQRQGAEKPQLDLSLSSQRNGGTTVSNSHNLNLQLSWELDLWQRLADRSNVAQHDLQAQRHQLQAAQNSLAARTASLWLDMAYAEQILATEQARIATLENSLAAIRERFSGGQGQLADLDAAASARSAAIAVRLQLQQQQAERQRQLNLLLGDSGQVAELPHTLPQIAAVPVSLPAVVVAQRPDIRTALEQLYSADRQALALAKDLYPRFSFSASAGYGSEQLDQLLSGSPLWQLLLNMTAPVFDSGRLETEAEIGRSAARRAWLNYRNTLLTALTEVEDSLQREQNLMQQIEQQSKALAHAENSLAYYRDRYMAGDADILDLLSAQRSLFDSRVNLLEARRQHQNNRITLALALGMGV